MLKDAPLTIAAAFVVIGLGAWRIVSWADSTTISGKDATIESLKTQIDAYKDKLGGDSPDEAKARIDSLETRLASIEPRHLSAKQVSDILQVINSMPAGKYSLSIQSDMSCSDCAGFVAQLSGLFPRDHWSIQLPMVMGVATASPKGITVLTPDPLHPLPEAAALISALTKAKVPFDVNVGSDSLSQEGSIASLSSNRQPIAALLVTSRAFVAVPQAH